MNVERQRLGGPPLGIVTGAVSISDFAVAEETAK